MQKNETNQRSPQLFKSIFNQIKGHLDTRRNIKKNRYPHQLKAHFMFEKLLIVQIDEGKSTVMKLEQHTTEVDNIKLVLALINIFILLFSYHFVYSFYDKHIY